MDANMQMNSLIVLCFFFSFTGIAASNPNLSGDHIFINCGSTAAASTALNGREWIGDLYPKFSSSIRIEGSSTRSSVKRELLTSVDPVPYKTARVSRSRFSYTFQLSPGQKFIRLHFNPTSYNGFQRFNDLFTVEAGPFTLLAKFSASVTADDLALNTFVKEFCITVQENQSLNIVFSPATKDTYAFINGIEIISVPSSLSNRDIGVQVVGHKSLIYIDNLTALEMVHRQNIIRDSSVVSRDDIRGLFRIWAIILKGKANKISNMSWKISVDVGFRYLIRVHFCELGLRMVENSHKDFTILIDRMIASNSADILHERGDNGILWYKNYMVMVKGHKHEGKRDILVSLHFKEEFMDGLNPLEGFEIFKLSNDENSLASPSLLLPRDSSSQNIQIFVSVLGRRNGTSTVVFVVLCLVNTIVHMLQQNWGRSCTMEENKPLARVKRLCRCFPLAEIQSATENFFDGFVIGRGGFGKVYKGLLDNGQEKVAIKRLKSSSQQGKREFQTEVETLSVLRHINIVPLIGYCDELQEMIIVYEYMPCGTLADHLYKLSRKNIGCPPLSWKQRLKICIGAGRGLDYLHTGHGIIHRDIKTSNILLDEKLVAKVSDFGLAKIGSGSELLQSHASTNLKGTLGYIDPDFFKTHKFTTKSDIYSFGVVLLEVLCGRPALEPEVEEDKHSLSMWAKDNISKGEVDQIVAQSLREEISQDSLQTFVTVAEKCLLDEPKKRPTISHVVIKLELALEQQENAESLAPKQKTSVAHVLPQMENLRFSEPNVADALPGNNRTICGDEASVSPAGLMLPQPNLRIFTFSELKSATRNFKSDIVLGEGGFGKVYKGWIDVKSTGKASIGTVIAVKKLNSESTHGFQEWQSEVNFLGRLSHPNLVKLLGYCWEDVELLLVYEFMQKGSLDNHLFGRGSSVQPLSWDIRLKILIGAAHGLACLHALDKQVIYRDFKASNILLDGSYNAKISDFGLAKLGPTASKSHVTTQVMGTYGYAAPEYVATGHLYVKSDVYGFGVVLVEMLTGLRALDSNRPSGQHNLVDWIKPHLSERRKLKHIIDSRLKGIYPSKSPPQIAQLARKCLENEPKRRPSMQEVVETLERIDAGVEKLRQPRVHFSQHVAEQYL